MSLWLNAVSTSIVLVYVMLITPNTCLKWSVVADKPLYLVFKSNHWFDLWLVGLPPTGCRSKVDLIHTDPNQASGSGQTYRFRSQSPVGRPTFSLTLLCLHLPCKPSPACWGLLISLHSFRSYPPPPISTPSNTQWRGQLPDVDAIVIPAAQPRPSVLRAHPCHRCR